MLSGCSNFVSSFVDTQPRVKLTNADYFNPSQIVEGKPVIYRMDKITSKKPIDPDLIKYAPVIVQGFQNNNTLKASHHYNYASDAFGNPYLSQDGTKVSINTNQPTIFSRIEHATFNNTKLKQLVYVIWYPQRPLGSIEKGEIDGNVLRITLDTAGRPAIFEATQTCGCFHGVFASRHIEEWAKSQSILKNLNSSYYLEQHDKSGWIIRDLIDTDPNSKPVLYFSAGTHACKAIQFETFTPNLSTYQTKRYTIKPYNTLNIIKKTGGGNGSMFNEAGFVLGAKRWKEEIVLSDLNHPGWPRHLDKMSIHWDKDKWTATNLLANNLNLPSQMLNPKATAIFTKNTSQTKLTKTTAQAHKLAQSIRSQYPNNKPFILLISNKYCGGCQEVKSHVLPSQKVQHALEAWNYLDLDTFNPNDASLANNYRVTATPTLIAFDHDGNEIYRSENIMTTDLMLKSLSLAHSADIP